jgi:hypothetical protein
VELDRAVGIIAEWGVGGCAATAEGCARGVPEYAAVGIEHLEVAADGERPIAQGRLRLDGVGNFAGPAVVPLMLERAGRQRLTAAASSSAVASLRTIHGRSAARKTAGNARMHSAAWMQIFGSKVTVMASLV